MNINPNVGRPFFPFPIEQKPNTEKAEENKKVKEEKEKNSNDTKENTNQSDKTTNFITDKYDK